MSPGSAVGAGEENMRMRSPWKRSGHAAGLALVSPDPFHEQGQRLGRGLQRNEVGVNRSVGARNAVGPPGRLQ